MSIRTKGLKKSLKNVYYANFYQSLNSRSEFISHICFSDENRMRLCNNFLHHIAMLIIKL